MLNLVCQKTHSDALLPTKAHESDFCYDVYAFFNQDTLITEYRGQDSYQVNPDIDKKGFHFIFAGESRALIPLGFSAQLSPSHLYLPLAYSSGNTINVPVTLGVKMFIRSGLASKKGLLLQNSVGIIDSAYPNEWMVCIFNPTYEPISIYSGDRIAQIQLSLSLDMGITEGEVIVKDRQGGFGSTGE